MQAKRALIGTLLTSFWFSVCELSLRWLTSRRVRRVDKLLVMKLTGRRIRRVNKLLVIKDKLVLMLPCLWNKQLVYSSTRSLVHLPCYPVFFTINLFTRLLVHLSTNCLYLLNIKVNISIMSIWVVWSIGVIRPILKKENEERCKWLFVNELWEGECEAFDHCKTVIA